MTSGKINLKIAKQQKMTVKTRKFLSNNLLRFILCYV